MDSSTELSPEETEALAVLELAAAAARAYDREDLQPGLESTRSLILDPEFVVVVAGEFKKGKSSLVNALVDAAVCPVDDDIATAVPTSVRHGDEVLASVLTGDDSVAVPIDEAARYIVEAPAGSADAALPDLVEIILPRRVLENGLVMVDTPGVGGLDSNHGASTLGALAFADLVIFVTDASQELTAPEMEFLGHAQRLCASVICVVTKTDFYPHWRQIVELDCRHFREAGVDSPLLPVSTPMRLEALRLDSRELNHESGYDELVRLIRIAESGRVGTAVRNAGRHASDVSGELAAPFESELAVLNDPARRDALLEDLTHAQERAEKLKSGGARWQHQLSDGLSDLSSDVMFDLKTRLRAAIEQTDALIESNNPSTVWDELETLTERAVREAIVANFELLRERTESLTSTVDENFESDSSEISSLVRLGPSDPAARDLAGKTEPASFGKAVGGALTGLRGTYSGMMMFNMLGGMLGLTVIAPVTIVLGVFMGGKAVKGERERQLNAARQSTRQSIRKFVDAASAETTKNIQDSVKQIQRTLRDHYNERARRLQLSTAESLTAAQNALKRDAVDATRVADLQAEVRRLHLLKERADELVSTGVSR